MNTKDFIILIILIFGKRNNNNLISASQWSNQHQINSNFTILWNISETELIMEMQVQALGLIGIGFSRESSVIEGSDAVFGWIEKDGKAFIQVSLDEFIAFKQS